MALGNVLGTDTHRKVKVRIFNYELRLYMEDQNAVMLYIYFVIFYIYFMYIDNKLLT